MLKIDDFKLFLKKLEKEQTEVYKIRRKEIMKRIAKIT